MLPSDWELVELELLFEYGGLYALPLTLNISKAQSILIEPDLVAIAVCLYSCDQYGLGIFRGKICNPYWPHSYSRMPSCLDSSLTVTPISVQMNAIISDLLKNLATKPPELRRTP